jgi:hypothetical protein
MTALQMYAKGGNEQAAEWVSLLDRGAYQAGSLPSAVGRERRFVHSWIRHIEEDGAWLAEAHLCAMAAVLGCEGQRTRPLIVVNAASLSDLVWTCNSSGRLMGMRSWKEMAERSPEANVLVWNGRDPFDGVQPL